MGSLLRNSSRGLIRIFTINPRSFSSLSGSR
jgi:hypothetical protein